MLFSYKAIDTVGSTITDTVEAPDRKSAIKQLSMQGLRPISIELTDKVATSTTAENINFFKTTAKPKRGFLKAKTSKPKLGLNFLKKLLELLQSGMPLGDAVKLISQRVTDPQLKELAGINGWIATSSRRMKMESWQCQPWHMFVSRWPPSSLGIFLCLLSRTEPNVMHAGISL